MGFSTLKLKEIKGKTCRGAKMGCNGEKNLNKMHDYYLWQGW